MPLVALLGSGDLRAADGVPTPSVPADPSASFTSALSTAMHDAAAAPAVPAGIALPQALVATMGQPVRVRQAERTPARAGQEYPAAADRDGAITRHVMAALTGRQEAPVNQRVANGGSGADAEWIGTVPGETDAEPATRDILNATDAALAAAFVPAVPGLPIGVPAVGELSSGGAGSAAAAPALHPVFRDRLERVIERMEAEFGYKVDVVETLRSQERQNTLFSQGRTAPGPVVTWTRNSHHTEGLAADLIVDGSYADPVAYGRLQRIAREEGLRTLGSRDRGHVELPRTLVTDGGAAMLDPEGHQSVGRAEAFSRAGALRSSSGAAATMPAAPAASGGIAQVATVASVARVAAVARVAEVARVGGGAPVPSRESPVVAQGEASTAPAPMPLVAAVGPRPIVETTVPAAVTPPGLVRQPREARPAVAVESASAAGDPRDQSSRIEARPVVANGLPPRDAGGEDTPRRESRRERQRETAPATPASMREPLEASLLRAFDPATRTTDFIGRAERTDALIGATAMDRIAELTELRDTAAERPMSSVLLRLDRPDGTEDRIRIGLRGASVGAAFEMSDSGMAEDLGRHLADLARSMERQGLDPEAMTVRTLNAKDAPVGASQAAAGERDALRAAAPGQAGNGNATGRDGRGSASRQDHPHDEPARQRPRRDSRGDR